MKDSRYNAGMWNYHPDLLMRAVPRYTSYPTAAEFAETVGAAEQASALQRVGMGDAVSLYVHIPFCQEICWYCGCNTGRANRTQRLEAYLEALRTEIATTAAMLNGRGHISRIAFGGGSPNALAPAEFTALVETLRETFSARDAALSIEIDPRSFTPQWAVALAIAGATKASLGVQTFDPAIQMAIGRVQDSELIARSVQSMRANGVDSINFDLMYGLPGQDEASLLATIEEAMTLRPERIALFGYAHVPHLLPRQRRINAERLPDQAERFAMAQLGHDRLVAEGYQPVGFDHFALPDDELASAARAGTLRRNFQGFTEDQAKTLIGLGASAISQFPDLLVQNEKNSGRYRMRALAGQLTGERGIARDREDRLRADAIESLLCERAIALDALPAQAEMIASLQPFIARGLATLAHGMLEISPEGRPYGRVIAAIFDRYRAEQPRRFSTAI